MFPQNEMVTSAAGTTRSSRASALVYRLIKVVEHQHCKTQSASTADKVNTCPAVMKRGQKIGFLHPQEEQRAISCGLKLFFEVEEVN